MTRPAPASRACLGVLLLKLLLVHCLTSGVQHEAIQSAIVPNPVYHSLRQLYSGEWLDTASVWHPSYSIIFLTPHLPPRPPLQALSSPVPIMATINYQLLQYKLFTSREGTRDDLWIQSKAGEIKYKMYCTQQLARGPELPPPHPHLGCRHTSYAMLHAL